MTNTTTTADLNRAQSAGWTAFENNQPAAPGVSSVIRTMIGDVPIGDPRAHALMTAFLQGYDKAREGAEPELDNKHLCAICGQIDQCFSYEYDKSTGKPTVWICYSDAEQIEEDEDEERRQYFLAEADRQLVTRALQAALGGKNFTTDEVDRILTIIDRFDA